MMHYKYLPIVQKLLQKGNESCELLILNAHLPETLCNKACYKYIIMALSFHIESKDNNSIDLINIGGTYTCCSIYFFRYI